MAPMQTNSILIKALCAEGASEQAWQDFYEAYKSTVSRWCVQQGLRQHEADDVLQATMTKMFLNIHTYDRSKGRFTPWIKTIVLNEVRDRFRKAGKSEAQGAVGGSTHQQIVANFVEDQSDDANLEQESIVAEIFRAVQSRVKEDNWNMFIRAKFLKEDATSIAKEFGLKRATVHMNVYRITKMLKSECESTLWANENVSK